MELLLLTKEQKQIKSYSASAFALSPFAPIAEIASVRHNEGMKAYLIDPPFETYGHEEERTLAAINLVSEIVFECLRRGGDTFQYSVVWANPGDEPGGIYDADIAVPHVFRLETDEALRDWLRKSVDPKRERRRRRSVDRDLPDRHLWIRRASLPLSASRRCASGLF